MSKNDHAFKNKISFLFFSEIQELVTFCPMTASKQIFIYIFVPTKDKTLLSELIDQTIIL